MKTVSKTLRRGKLHGRYQELSNHWNRGRDVPFWKLRGSCSYTKI
ncbi:hypothetical protein Cpin_4780 [Chitinophaga pinensis DSM 2588]|uniref:Uncharacterized protein n=1 Tax=Chitinophaga pinensis (strain ATCC 43595 / DSM 2588 / LMG 13176 / NBRC 15968 / NCIMB 11800 / UQM 2034) TaxID=485918 RepID=A0A979G788_CHIPD|nr:hypothetical protein Cpin_4780 [Chitinophaga pinensis DSM 2588]